MSLHTSCVTVRTIILSNLESTSDAFMVIPLALESINAMCSSHASPNQFGPNVIDKLELEVKSQRKD